MPRKILIVTTVSAVLVAVPALTYFYCCKNRREKLWYVFDLLAKGYNMLGIPEPPLREREEAPADWETVEEVTIAEGSADGDQTAEGDQTADEMDVAYYLSLYSDRLFSTQYPLFLQLARFLPLEPPEMIVEHAVPNNTNEEHANPPRLPMALVASSATSSDSIVQYVVPRKQQPEGQQKTDAVNPNRVYPRKVPSGSTVARFASIGTSTDPVMEHNKMENVQQNAHHSRAHPRVLPRKVPPRMPVMRYETSERETSTESIVRHPLPNVEDELEINEHKVDVAHHSRVHPSRVHPQKVPLSRFETSETSTDSIVRRKPPIYVTEKLLMNQEVGLRVEQHSDVAHQSRAHPRILPRMVPPRMPVTRYETSERETSTESIVRHPVPNVEDELEINQGVHFKEHTMDVAHHSRVHPSRVHPQKVPLSRFETSETSTDSIVRRKPPICVTENLLMNQEMELIVEHHSDVAHQSRVHPQKIPLSRFETSETSTDSIAIRRKPPIYVTEKLLMNQEMELIVEHHSDVADQSRVHPQKVPLRAPVPSFLKSETSIDSIEEMSILNYEEPEMKQEVQYQQNLDVAHQSGIQSSRVHNQNCPFRMPVSSHMRSDVSNDSIVHSTMPNYKNLEMSHEVQYEMGSEIIQQQQFGREEKINVESGSSYSVQHTLYHPCCSEVYQTTTDTHESSVTSICTLPVKSTQALHDLQSTMQRPEAN